MTSGSSYAIDLHHTDGMRDSQYALCTLHMSTYISAAAVFNERLP